MDKYIAAILVNGRVYGSTTPVTREEIAQETGNLLAWWQSDGLDLETVTEIQVQKYGRTDEGREHVSRLKRVGEPVVVTLPDGAVSRPRNWVRAIERALKE